MPEKISFWVALIASFGSLFLGTFCGGLVNLGWVARGLWKDKEKVSSDAAEAVALARLTLERHNDLAQVVSGFGERLTQMSEEHEEMRDLVMLKLPNMVEAAIGRATEAASAAAWHRSRTRKR